MSEEMPVISINGKSSVPMVGDIETACLITRRPRAAPMAKISTGAEVGRYIPATVTA